MVSGVESVGGGGETGLYIGMLFVPVCLSVSVKIFFAGMQMYMNRVPSDDTT